MIFLIKLEEVDQWISTIQRKNMGILDQHKEPKVFRLQTLFWELWKIIITSLKIVLKKTIHLLVYKFLIWKPCKLNLSLKLPENLRREWSIQVLCGLIWFGNTNALNTSYKISMINTSIQSTSIKRLWNHAKDLEPVLEKMMKKTMKNTSTLDKRSHSKINFTSTLPKRRSSRLMRKEDKWSTAKATVKKMKSSPNTVRMMKLQSQSNPMGLLRNECSDAGVLRWWGGAVNKKNSPSSISSCQLAVCESADCDGTLVAHQDARFSISPYHYANHS